MHFYLSNNNIYLVWDMICIDIISSMLKKNEIKIKRWRIIFNKIVWTKYWSVLNEQIK